MAQEKFKTEQENIWATQFGSAWTNRNQDTKLIASNIALFSQALHKTKDISTCIEFGANTGLNLIALRTIFPEQQQYGLEINEEASKILKKNIPEDHVSTSSILEFDPSFFPNVEGLYWDLVLVKALLIHINPDNIFDVYKKLYQSTKRYLLICEYYNPNPISVNYRGQTNVLFKRDFSGEIMETYPDMVLRDYGFVYHRDPVFPQDDLNWFLLEKI